MSKIKYIFNTLVGLRSRFGIAKTLKHATSRLINRFIYFDCLHIIVLNCENLKPLDDTKTKRFNTRIAELQDLEGMQTQGDWDINETKIDFFKQGDSCMLNYVDGKLAGYTWAHTNGCPELLPGLRISVPHEYLYNFAGFTHPDFRGYGLQSYRHHALLNHHQWKDRKALLGFVNHTNYSSKRGQNKSGYKKIGSIRLIGTKSQFCTLIDKNLRSIGIKRIN